MKKIFFLGIIALSLLSFFFVFADWSDFNLDLNGNEGLGEDKSRLSTPNGSLEEEDKSRLSTPNGSLEEDKSRLSTPDKSLGEGPVEKKEDADIGIVYHMLLSAADWFFTFLIALAVVAIVISGIMFVFSGGDPNKATTARNIAIYALVGVLVGSLGWALVNWVRSFFS